jgi:hypothetical protein
MVVQHPTAWRCFCCALNASDRSTCGRCGRPRPSMFRVALLLLLGLSIACSPVAPTIPPAPPIDGPVLRESPRPELPPDPLPEYFAALSVWSTVVPHPAIATAALDVRAPIVGSVHADPAPVRFEWDFGDGAGGRFESRVDRVEYRYRSTGWKTVDVWITDAGGRRAHNSVQILMAEFAP